MESAQWRTVLFSDTYRFMLFRVDEHSRIYQCYAANMIGLVVVVSWCGQGLVVGTTSITANGVLMLRSAGMRY